MPRSDVFVDTSGLYALVDKKDANYEVAKDEVGKITRNGQKLVVSDYVIDEAVTLAKTRSGARVALRILDLIEQSVGIRIERIDVGRFDEAKAFFRRHADHDYSFTDCSSFVLMRELELRHALTSDRHFNEAGFEVLLARR
jgi:predicted nucleic acid-binding protein